MGAEVGRVWREQEEGKQSSQYIIRKKKSVFKKATVLVSKALLWDSVVWVGLEGNAGALPGGTAARQMAGFSLCPHFNSISRLLLSRVAFHLRWQWRLSSWPASYVPLDLDLTSHLKVQIASASHLYPWLPLMERVSPVWGASAYFISWWFLCHNIPN